MPLKKIDYLPFLESCWQEHLEPRADDAPTVVSLFAGCGGSSLGYSMAGYRELLAVEWDDNAVETFKLNFPGVPVYHGDIAKLSVKECLQMTGLKPGELDILDGSPPCQGFSTAGKRQLDDPRNQLFREFVRLLRGLHPKVFVMENVSGMVKGVMKLVFAEILRELKASGYKVKARLLNAMYFNVPQSRERMIFIGVREDLGIEPSHPVGESVPITVKDSISDLLDIQMLDIQHIWIDETPNGRNTRTFQLAKDTRQGEKYAGQKRRAVYSEPFPTITKPSSDGMGINQYLRNSHCHPIFTRTFSVRELARGSSYPDSFVFTGLEGANRIGNSVPPLFARAWARHIRDAILVPPVTVQPRGAGTKSTNQSHDQTY